MRERHPILQCGPQLLILIEHQIPVRFGLAALVWRERLTSPPHSQPRRLRAIL